MSKKSFIDSVEVGSPCSEDWNQMQGTDKIRLCSHCVKHVNNLSEMTRKEAARLVRASNGNICIRYIADPVTKRPMFAEQLFQITRRTPGIAAGVMTASVSLSTLAYSQEAPNPASPIPAVVQTDKILMKMGEIAQKTPRSDPSASISGTVTDPAGAFVGGTIVEIINEKTEEKRTTNTNDEGVYAFEDLPPASYQMRFSGKGFRIRVVTSVVLGGESIKQDATLEIGMIMGDMAITLPQFKNPLMHAVQNEDVDEIKNLVVHGADVNGKEEDKTTPLFIAVETGNIEIVRTLLDFGANVNARNREKQTPLMRLDADATPELVNLLVRHGVKLNLIDNEGNTAIMIAADSATPATLKALIDAGADVRLSNKEGQTALMNAVSSGEIESVRLLIQAGSDVKAKNKDGDTVLDQASDDEIKALLVTFGAKTDKEPDEEENEDTSGN